MDRRAVILATSAFLLGPGAARAEPPGGNPGKKEDKGGDGLDLDITVVIGDEDRRRIREYFGSRPGLSGKPLPPGMRNRLAKGKSLPPGIAKQVLPADLLALLSIPHGYEPYLIGTDVVLVAVASGIIVDILLDVF